MKKVNKEVIKPGPRRVKYLVDGLLLVQVTLVALERCNNDKMTATSVHSILLLLSQPLIHLRITWENLIHHEPRGVPILYSTV